MKIENMPRWADTHPKNYPNILKSWNIYGTAENTKKYVTDKVNMICFLFLEYSCILQILHIKWAFFHANYEGFKIFKCMVKSGWILLQHTQQLSKLLKTEI